MSRALSTLPQVKDSFASLTYREQQIELEVARLIVREAIVLAGLPVEAAAAIRVTMSARLTSALGRAINHDVRGQQIKIRRNRLKGTRERVSDPQPWPNPRGEIRLSASVLWRRDGPEGRRDTVIHELGHVLAESQRFGACHGPVWRTLVRAMGGDDSRCHKVQPVRKPGHERRTVVRAAALAPVVLPPQRFVAGDVVAFGRGNGEKTRGRVVRVSSRTLTVEALEERGRGRGGKKGGRWRVSPTLCRKEEK